MIIRDVDVTAFGKFSGARITFQPGFNLVFGPNEAGKSTLLTFIEFMLFGAKQEGRTRKYYLERHDKYQPWDTNTYEGFLRFNAGSGNRLYEIYRNFIRDADTVTLHDATTGKDLSSEFTRDKRDELLFAHELLGLSRSLFLNTIMIPQLALKDGFAGNAKEMSTQIIKALSGSQDDKGTDDALELLDKALTDGVGKTERGKRSGELLKQIETLQAEREKAVQHREELVGLKQQASTLQSREKTLKQLVADLEQKQALERKEELQKTIEKAERLTKEIREARAQAEDYLQYRDFPLELADQVAGLERRKNELVNDIEENKQRRESAYAELNSRNLELMPLDAYIDVEPGEKERIIELKFKWKTAAKELEAVRQGIQLERSRNREKQERFDELNELFSALGNNVEDRLETLEGRLEDLDKKMIKATSQAKEMSSEAGHTRSFTISFTFFSLVSALAAILFALWDHSNPSAIPYVSPVLSLLASCSVAAAIYYRRKDRLLKRSFDIMQEDYERLIEARRDTGRERGSMFSLAGVKNLREFYSLQAEFKRLKEELAGSAVMIDEKRLPKLEEREKSLREEILGMLRDVNLSKQTDVPGDNDISLFVSNVEKTSKVVTQVDEAHRRLEEIDNRTAELEEESKQIKAELKSLYQRSGTERFTDFERHKEGRIAYDSCKQRIQRNEENLEFLLKDQSLSDLQNQMAGLDKVLADVDADTVFSGPFKADELNKSKAQLLKAREDRAELEGNIARMLKSYIDPADFDLQLEQAEAELETIRIRREALKLAIDTVINAREQLHADFAPHINSHIGSIIAAVTGGRYDQVLTSDTFDLSVRNPGNNAIVQADSLSSGTRDQLFFAARLAIAQVLSSEDAPLPLFLDDSFVEYDYQRARESFTVLKELSAGRQILFFTCHERERELFTDLLGDNGTLIDLSGEAYA